MIVLLALAGDASEAAAVRGKTDFTAFCFGFSVRVLKNLAVCPILSRNCLKTPVFFEYIRTWENLKQTN